MDVPLLLLLVTTTFLAVFTTTTTAIRLEEKGKVHDPIRFGLFFYLS